MTRRTHLCPAVDCVRQVSYRLFACPTHWRALPDQLRADISAAWQAGDASAHRQAMQAAVEWYRQQRGEEPSHG